MAAFDLFRSVISELSEAERTTSDELIHQAQTDLLAARSEEARVRIVHGFVAELHELRGQAHRRPMRTQPH
jgi:hypothetical protein